MEIDEDLVRDTLFGLLRSSSMEPQPDWISVRVLRQPGTPLVRTYVVVIKYPAARDVLLPELDEVTGTRQEAGRETGVWVLTSEEAERLCRRQAGGA
ncbi:MAG: hypothetical protein C5B46_09655 [Proteobacteria bacterium]|nr:MAG: hypothetical protein C5B46_09655 [Pseudomonadota bacterium]